MGAIKENVAKIKNNPIGAVVGALTQAKIKARKGVPTPAVVGK